MFKGLLEKMLKPLGKALAVRMITSEGDKLQASLSAAVLAKGPKAIDDVVDRFQAKMLGAVEGLSFLPGGMKSAIGKAVQEYGDKIQAKAASALASGGISAMNNAIDLLQEELIERVKAL
jgi:hypothetical protein